VERRRVGTWNLSPGTLWTTSGDFNSTTKLNLWPIVTIFAL